MSKNFHSEIDLHIVWHTKQSLPLLTPEIEAFTHQFLRQRLIDTPGVFVHEIGGTETHVHLCITIPPTVAVSELIGQFKGASAYEVNHQNRLQNKLLQWQSGYGVVSFGTRDLQWVKDYVNNQREHHGCDTVHDRLERITAGEPLFNG